MLYSKPEQTIVFWQEFDTSPWPVAPGNQQNIISEENNNDPSKWVTSITMQIYLYGNMLHRAMNMNDRITETLFILFNTGRNLCQVIEKFEQIFRPITDLHL